MSGVVELKIDDLNQILNSYNQSLGLQNVKYNKEVEQVLSYNSEQLKAISEEEACQGAFLLSQYALFLQKEANRNNSIAKWAGHNLSVIIGKYANNYGNQYTKYEEKRAMIISDNEYAKKLAKILVDAEVFIEEISFISSRVEAMSKILLEYQKTKRGQRYGNS